MKRKYVVLIMVVFVSLLLVGCGGGKPSRDATDSEIDQAFEPMFMLTIHALFTLPYQDFSTSAISYEEEGLSVEVKGNTSGFTYKVTGNVTGEEQFKNIDADFTIKGVTLEEISNLTVGDLGSNQVTISGTLLWGESGEKLYIQDVTFVDSQEASGLIWYTLPHSKEVVNIPLDEI